MKIYIQSKSGKFNTTIEYPHMTDKSEIGEAVIFPILASLRQLGGYTTKYRDQAVLVPFEEIEFIRIADEGDNE